MKKLVLVVIDGLTAEAFESAVDEQHAPALAFLVENGSYGRAVSTFPSLTPVCLSSLATGAHPDVHGIPHLVWWHREERRVVEYGSSAAALRAAGMTRALRDTILDMNRRHLSADATTVYEALEAAGLTTAAINITCYRGTTRHVPTVPGVPAVFGPKRFFFFNLFESDVTGAPLAIRNRAAGSIDAYAAAVGRWLVTRDGFDFLVYYLPDYDFASHAHGPDEAREALARSDAAVETLLLAAGGRDEFLDRYAVILCADHGQSHVRETARLQATFAGDRGVLVTASNRAGMLYRLDERAAAARELAERASREKAVDVAAFLDDGDVVVARDGDASSTDALEHPDALERLGAALRNRNAGEVLVSAADGWEFADLGGRHHLGGGSHGSLSGADSLVPMLTVGLERVPQSITDVMPLALDHFGVERPGYAAGRARAA